MADVLALVDDLFFQAKMLETAKHLGVDLRTCSTADALEGEIAKAPPKLVVVDLNARSEPLAAIERMKRQPQPFEIVAFLSHVQADLAARAKAAGCNFVMPRSQFTRDLATILSKAKSQS
jgi:DNA-binding NarL/FixJ family response regulator